MDFMTTIISLTTITNLAFETDAIITVELKIPNFFTDLFGIEEPVQKFRASSGVIDDLSIDSEEENYTVEEAFSKYKNDAGNTDKHSNDIELVKITVGGIDNVASLYQTIQRSYEQTLGTGYKLLLPILFNARNMRRVEDLRPVVDMAPGAIKTEIVTYPPNYLKGRLLYLMKLKEKQQETNG